LTSFTISSNLSIRIGVDLSIGIEGVILSIRIRVNHSIGIGVNQLIRVGAKLSIGKG
jgi:hypothetical protein